MYIYTYPSQPGSSRSIQDVSKLTGTLTSPHPNPEVHEAYMTRASWQARYHPPPPTQTAGCGSPRSVAQAATCYRWWCSHGRISLSVGRCYRLWLAWSRRPKSKGCGGRSSTQWHGGLHFVWWEFGENRFGRCQHPRVAEGCAGHGQDGVGQHSVGSAGVLSGGGGGRHGGDCGHFQQNRIE